MIITVFPLTGFYSIMWLKNWWSWKGMNSIPFPLTCFYFIMWFEKINTVLYVHLFVREYESNRNSSVVVRALNCTILSLIYFLCIWFKKIHIVRSFMRKIYIYIYISNRYDIGRCYRSELYIFFFNLFSMHMIQKDPYSMFI